MSKYRFWDKEETLYPPAGEPRTKEFYFKQYAWCSNPAAKVVTSTGAISQCFLSFEMMRDSAVKEGMVIPEGATDDDVLQLIEEWESREIPGEPSYEERIAAALEFQNVLGM